MRLDDKEIMLLWEQGVPGSNPGTPTFENQGVVLRDAAPFCFSPFPMNLLVLQRTENGLGGVALYRPSICRLLKKCTKFHLLMLFFLGIKSNIWF